MSLHSCCMQSHKTLTLDTTIAFISRALNAFNINCNPSFYINLFYSLFLFFIFKNTLPSSFHPQIIFMLMDSKKVLLTHANTYAFPGLQKHINEKKTHIFRHLNFPLNND